MKFLAAGGFGQVYSAKYRGERVAVKVITSFTCTPESLKSFREEVTNCNSIRSRYVVPFLGACVQEPNLAMVMELMSGGSLSALLRSPVELSWSVRLTMLEEIAFGINVLHSNKPTIIHRDLKCANVLLDEHHHCKLADFGFAIVKEDSTSKTGVASGGTLAWMAPELFSLRPKFSTKSDIYAFGMIMWEIAARKIPYQDAHPQVIQHCVLEGEREEIPVGCPDGYSRLMQKCWDAAPSERPNVAHILETISGIKVSCM